ncbi:TetR family transcriptional regulator [Kitasatospora sp. NPDC004272]
MTQERAARTRQALVRAAAGEFDRGGYAGSSLAKISKAAGISMGALTFHFQTKEQLAATVRAQGYAMTRTVVQQVGRGQEVPVHSVVSLTLALAELLEQEPVVRAAARLTRERSGTGPDWTLAWVPDLREWLDRTVRDGSVDLPDQEAVATLAAHLVIGAEADARRLAERGLRPGGCPVARLSAVWDLMLRGISVPRQGG